MQSTAINSTFTIRIYYFGLLCNATLRRINTSVYWSCSRFPGTHEGGHQYEMKRARHYCRRLVALGEVSSYWIVEGQD